MMVSGLLSATLFVVAGVAARAAPPAERPNVLVIVADDMGYSDLGAFGSEIATPNLDRLAREGALLTNFHTAPVCAPTRAMLLTGTDNHRAGVGNTADWISATQRGQADVGGQLTHDLGTIAEHLHANGYFTVMTGKWDLGQEEGQSPAARGFDRSYALLQGASDHWGGDQDSRWSKVGWASTYREGRTIVRFPEGAFTGDVFTDRMLGYVREAADRRKPFFAYLAFTDPHWPLQAHAEDIAKYRGRYDAGPTVLRKQRIANMRKLGLLGSAAPADVVGMDDWEALSPDQRAIEARKMEIYAAMVDRMDQNVGRLLEVLRETDQLKNTFVVFLSDNGAEAQPLDGPPRLPKEVVSGTLRIDNRLANMGLPGSYIAYGPSWAQASSPYYLFKGQVTEGGIRTPAFAWGPGVRSASQVDSFTHVKDIVPTILHMAGSTPLTRLEGRDLAPIEGRDLSAVLSGKRRDAHSADEPFGWELLYRGAIRIGDWKAVRIPAIAGLPNGGGVTTPAWRLFNLSRDPGETVDLAKQEPARLRRLLVAWRDYARRSGIVLPDGYDGTTAPASLPQR